MVGWGKGQFECSGQTEGLEEGAVWVLPAYWCPGGRGNSSVPSILMSWGTGQFECSQHTDVLGDGAIRVFPASWEVGRRGSLSVPSKLRSWGKGNWCAPSKLTSWGKGQFECSQQIEELGEGELECSQQTEVSNYLTFKCVCFQHTAASNHSTFSYFSHWAVITCGWLKPCKSVLGVCVFMCGVMGRSIYISFVNTSNSANKGDN